MNGKEIKIKKEWLLSEGGDINILEEYQNSKIKDPRTIGKIVNGKYITRDD